MEMEKLPGEMEGVAETPTPPPPPPTPHSIGEGYQQLACRKTRMQSVCTVHHTEQAGAHLSARLVRQTPLVNIATDNQDTLDLR